MGLLGLLPPKGKSWTHEQRDAFVALMSAALDVAVEVYPQ
jgi:hypothetical protein